MSAVYSSFNLNGQPSSLGPVFFLRNEYHKIILFYFCNFLPAFDVKKGIFSIKSLLLSSIFFFLKFFFFLKAKKQKKKKMDQIGKLKILLNGYFG